MATKPKAARYTTDLLSIPGMAFDVNIQDPRDRIQAYIDSYNVPDMAAHKVCSSRLACCHPIALKPEAELIWQGFDEDFMRTHIKIDSAMVSAGKATAVFSMRAAPEFTNRMGNMHGGAVAMIYDMCTTMCAAPLAKEGFWVFGGVSRTLTVTYLRPVREAMELLIECEVLQQGRRLTTIRGQIRDRSDGSLLSVAEHNKASIEFKAKV